MEQKNCIKFSYCGVTRFIICERNCRYEDIIKLVAENFEIPKAKESAIYLTNGKGYIFGKTLFEYFILLFPQPELIFYIRLDYSNNQNISTPTPSQATELAALRQDDRVPFGFSKLNNKKRSRKELMEGEANDDEAAAYLPAPVRRQNCFLGFLPRSNEDLLPVDYLEDNPLFKRICRFNKEKKQMSTLRTTSQMSKRNLRL